MNTRTSKWKQERMKSVNLGRRMNTSIFQTFNVLLCFVLIFWHHLRLRMRPAHLSPKFPSLSNHFLPVISSSLAVSSLAKKKKLDQILKCTSSPSFSHQIFQKF